MLALLLAVASVTGVPYYGNATAVLVNRSASIGGITALSTSNSTGPHNEDTTPNLSITSTPDVNRSATARAQGSSSGERPRSVPVGGNSSVLVQTGLTQGNGTESMGLLEGSGAGSDRHGSSGVTTFGGELRRRLVHSRCYRLRWFYWNHPN